MTSTPTSAFKLNEGVSRVIKELKKVGFLILLMGFQFLVSCGGDEETGGIYGSISNEMSDGSGERISNAKVIIAGPTSTSVTTGDNGQYQFNDIKTGIYTVTVEHGDYINAESQQIPLELDDFIQVDLTMTPKGAIEVSPSSLNFGADKSELTLTVKNIISTDFNYEIDIANSWITLNKTNGSLASENSVSIAVTVNRKALELGNNEGAFTINIPGRSSFTVNVFVLHDPQIPLEITPGSLDFNTAVTSLELAVKNTSNDPVNYEIQSPGDWISLSKTQGVLTGNNTDLLTVTVNRDRLSIGSHDGTIIFNVADQGSKAITVLATKLDATAAVLVLEQGVLDFGKSLDQRSLTISNEGDNTLIWELNTSDSWISASEVSGSLPPNNTQSITIFVNRNDRSDGEYTGKLSFTSNGGNGEVSIKMEIDNTNTGGGGEIVVTSGLRAYYTFDDGTVKDEMGNFTAVPIGVTPSDDSPVAGGKSMEFDGVDDFIQLSDNPLFNSNNGVIHGTTSYWIKTSSGGEILAVPRKIDDTRNNFLNAIEGGRVIHSVSPLVSGCCGTFSQFNFDVSTLIIGGWHHLAITYDGSDKTASLYIDGIRLSIENYVIGVELNAEGMRIGHDYGDAGVNLSTSAYSGHLDNIRIYNRPLTSSEVEEIFDAKQ